MLRCTVLLVNIRFCENLCLRYVIIFEVTKIVREKEKGNK